MKNTASSSLLLLLLVAFPILVHPGARPDQTGQVLIPASGEEVYHTLDCPLVKGLSVYTRYIDDVPRAFRPCPTCKPSLPIAGVLIPASGEEVYHLRTCPLVQNVPTYQRKIRELKPEYRPCAVCKPPGPTVPAQSSSGQASSGRASPQSSTLRVERVIDGDTIVVQGVGTVRLIGVDTPETVDPRKPVEYFGLEASAFLKQLVEGQPVRLEYDQQRTDRYGRTLAYVYLAGGTFVNAEIIRQGYGHAYTEFPFRHLEVFRDLEQAARVNNRGLWAAQTRSDTPSTPPTAAPTDPMPAASSGDENVTVYVTRTGTKYHRAGCRFLARSQIPMPLKEAAARYGPCSVCKPPVPRKQ